MHAMSIAMIVIFTLGLIVLLMAAALLLAVRHFAVVQRQQAKQDVALAKAMDKWMAMTGAREARQRQRRTERRAARLSNAPQNIIRPALVHSERQRA
jgi:uncharacterized protein HemX